MANIPSMLAYAALARMEKTHPADAQYVRKYLEQMAEWLVAARQHEEAQRALVRRLLKEKK